MKGWGPKSSIRPSKPGKSNFLGGISRDFAGISRGRPKSLRKKSLGSIFVPYSKQIFGHPARSTKLDRPHCKQFQFVVLKKQVELQVQLWILREVTKITDTDSRLLKAELQKQLSMQFIQITDTLSLKNYQYSTEGRNFHQNSAPVLVIISGNSLVFSRIFLPVLIFTGTAPRRASTSSGNKSVSQIQIWISK